MKKVFLLIGHSNWGKSETLYHLTNKNRRKKYFKINEEWFFVRRMSNDDNELSLDKFIKSATKYKSHLIVAFCPTFEKGSAYQLLKELAKNFEINSFVLLHKYDGSNSITKEELKSLKQFGRVEVLEERQEATLRAKGFEDFIVNNL
jgi:hypothetical protein